MRAYVNNYFSTVFSDDLLRVYFVEGDEIEILKTINDKLFKSKIGYVIYNPRNHESATVDSVFVDIHNNE